MAFVDYEYFKTLYGADAIDSLAFNRFEYDAERLMKNITTTVDGISKLEVAYPTKESDVEAIKRCICSIVDYMDKIDKANEAAENGKVVSAISAGNESISYATNGGLVGSVMVSKEEQTKLFNHTIDGYLRGIKDANGVNLLYRGVYPY